MVAIGCSLPLGRAPDERGQVAGFVADLAERPVALEEAPGLLIVHPQRDRLRATPALDVELDHWTNLPLIADSPGLPSAPPATHSPRALSGLYATVVPDGRSPRRQLHTPSRSHCYVILGSAAAMTEQTGSGIRGVKN